MSGNTDNVEGSKRACQFFETCSSVDDSDLYDTLLTRYANIEFVLNLEYGEFKRLITKMHLKKEEEKAWQLWVSLYPDMHNESFIPFSEYLERTKRPLTKDEIREKPKEQLLDELNELRKQFELPSPETELA
jgi:hypothetical protein